ncbi:MAG: RyR domain-containing protein, partial [Bacteroidota bacterium]
KKENVWTTIIIALDDDAEALSCALGFLLRLENPAIPIIVRMSEETGLAVLLQSEAAASAWMASIHPFGMTGDICTGRMLMDEKLDMLARKIHEDFVSKRLKEGRSTDDPSMVPWEKLNPDMKDSNRQQADHITIKLHAIGCSISAEEKSESDFNGFTVDEVEILACMEHNRWVAERLLAGWRLGLKEPGKRQSPYLVSWEDLPDPIREYDRETVRNIPAILELTGSRIVRKPAVQAL